MKILRTCAMAAAGLGLLAVPVAAHSNSSGYYAGGNGPGLTDTGACELSDTNNLVGSFGNYPCSVVIDPAGSATQATIRLSDQNSGSHVQGWWTAMDGTATVASGPVCGGATIAFPATTTEIDVEVDQPGYRAHCSGAQAPTAGTITVNY